MTVAIQRTVQPDGEIKEHPYGMKVSKRKLSDKEFNSRSKNILKLVNKTYGIKK